MFKPTTVVEKYSSNEQATNTIFPKHGRKQARLYYRLRCQELDEKYGIENNVRLKKNEYRIRGYCNPQHEVAIEWDRGACNIDIIFPTKYPF